MAAGRARGSSGARLDPGAPGVQAWAPLATGFWHKTRVGQLAYSLMKMGYVHRVDR
jgi:hypothetical protein